MAKSEKRVACSTSTRQRMEKSTSNALIVYVSQEAWLKSVLEGRHGIVETDFDYRTKELEKDEDEIEDFSNYKFEDDILYLRSLDPKEWKAQDHYAVLGIKDLRHRATEDVIKRAYKHKILRHHPDKRKAKGEEVKEDDDYFTNITRAWEILGNPVKRRSYDSVDPYFNDNLPDEKEVKENFYKLMTEAFKMNSRWSIKKPVPKLGGPDTPRDKVEKFYMFWYDFESWREYSYEDEEDKESGENRETRRWIEKKNKTVRSKKKKEEMTRIRQLVDMAYSLDPRIRMFQQQDKDKKMAVKRAKQEAARARILEEERVVREAAEKERLEKEKKEAEEKAKADQLKQEREIQKKALRRERRSLRDICKENNYFAETSEETIRHMENVEKICELFKATQLGESVKSLRAEGKPAFIRLMCEVDEKIEAERKAIFGNSDTPKGPERQVKAHSAPWTETELQLLIKAVNLFPAGTNQRWEVVANFINQHSNSAEGIKRDAKEVLAKAKDLQSTDFSKSSLKEQANKKAFDNFVADKKKKDVDDRMPAVTERLDNPVTIVTNGKNHGKNSNNSVSNGTSQIKSSINTIPNCKNKSKNSKNSDTVITNGKSHNKNSTDSNRVITNGKNRDESPKTPVTNGTCKNRDKIPKNPVTNGNGYDKTNDEKTNETKEEIKEKKGEPTPWTPAEQKLLEQALKTYPASASDRWEQISACIPTRSKKECMKRYKELVELVKAKKAAQVLK